MIVSEKRLTKALTYLAETDEEIALALGLFKGLEDQNHTIHAQCFKQSDPSTSATAAKIEAYAHPEYTGHLLKIRDARTQYEILKTKRSTEERIVDVWRSEESSRRAAGKMT